MIRKLIEEIALALDAQLNRLALLASLAVPDIAGALDSTDGQATRSRYIKWVNRWAVPYFSQSGFQTISGEDCYRYRCALIHQGHGQHPGSRYVDTLFVTPPPGTFIAPMTPEVSEGTAIVLDIPTFCRWIIAATEDWLEQVEDSDLFVANSEKALRLCKMEVHMN